MISEDQDHAQNRFFQLCCPLDDSYLCVDDGVRRWASWGAVGAGHHFDGFYQNCSWLIGSSEGENNSTKTVVDWLL